MDYRELVRDHLVKPPSTYTIHPTVMTGWDNTARRPNVGSTFVNATPEMYEIWLREIVARTVENREPEERLVFVNAWNEWAEGAHLEPDRRYGLQYLVATRRAVCDEPVDGAPFTRFSGRTRFENKRCVVR
jgi:lipopolysaccharide biosynthesis protein